MARVYLSFLGTNDYLSCCYFKNDKKLENVRFVQQATLKFFCDDWTLEDRILIFTTDEAYRKNWLNDGHQDHEGKILKQRGLRYCIKSLKLLPSVHRVAIPEGKTEQEIWDIFQIVYDSLRIDDEVVIDITHAFRSIPMLAVVVLNYAKVMKKIALHGIYYGAFEVLGSIQEARRVPATERLVPVFDLAAFDQLLDWTLAVDRFLGAGDAKAVSALATKAVMPILKDSKGGDAAAAAIKKMADSLENYTRNLATCRILEIDQSVVSLRERIEKSRHLDLVKPLFHLFEPIEQQVREFKGDIVGDGIQAAKWCLECNLIQQGVTILFETLITYLLVRVGAGYLDEGLRNAASSAAQLYSQNKPENKWKGDAAIHAGITKKIMKLCAKNTEVAKLIDRLREVRNDLNHSGYKKGSLKARDLEKKFRSELKRAALLCRTSDNG